MGTSKHFFTFLIIVVAGTGIWMGGQFVYNLHHYFLLSEVTETEVNEWEVEEFKPGKFTLNAKFEFQVGERKIYESYRFKKPVYQNPYLPEALIERWEGESWRVWYNPKDPHFVSLQKKTPLKEGVYFALCLGVLLYFSWLRVYVNKVGSVDPR